MTTAEALKLMGKRVRVIAEVKPVVHDSIGWTGVCLERKWERDFDFKEEWCGWFVGLRTVYEGVKIASQSEDAAPRKLHRTKSLQVALVVPGPGLNPRYVPVKGNGLGWSGFRVLEEGEE